MKPPQQDFALPDKVKQTELIPTQQTNMTSTNNAKLVSELKLGPSDLHTER